MTPRVQYYFISFIAVAQAVISHLLLGTRFFTDSIQHVENASAIWGKGSAWVSYNYFYATYYFLLGGGVELGSKLPLENPHLVLTLLQSLLLWGSVIWFFHELRQLQTKPYSALITVCVLLVCADVMQWQVYVLAETSFLAFLLGSISGYCWLRRKSDSSEKAYTWPWVGYVIALVALSFYKPMGMSLLFAVVIMLSLRARKKTKLRVGFYLLVFGQLSAFVVLMNTLMSNHSLFVNDYLYGELIYGGVSVLGDQPYSSAISIKVPADLYLPEKSSVPALDLL